MTEQNTKPTKDYFAFTNDIYYLGYYKGNPVNIHYDMIKFRWYCPACDKIPECKGYKGYSICSLKCYSNNYTIKCPRGHKLNMYLYLKNNNCTMKHIIDMYLIHILFATARMFIQTKENSKDKDKNKWLMKKQFFYNDWSPKLDTELLKAIWDTVLETYHTIVDNDSSYFILISYCDKNNNEYNNFFDNDTGSKITQLCHKMIEADDFAPRPILELAKKKVKEIREEYDEILGMNIKIKIKCGDDDYSLDPEKLDAAFMEIIIADYVESIMHKQKIIIEIDTDDPPDAPKRADQPTLGSA